jgi:hypothetical protein
VLSVISYIAVVLGVYAFQLYVCVILSVVLYTVLAGFQVHALFVFLHSVLALAVVVSVVQESGHSVLSIESSGE